MSMTDFATMYPPWFTSWNHFYNAVLCDQAQDDDEYVWELEPVANQGKIRYQLIPDSPYHYQVRYIERQALLELRAKTFDFEESNVIYQAVEQYANQFKGSVIYDNRLKPLIDKLEGIARKVPFQR